MTQIHEAACRTAHDLIDLGAALYIRDIHLPRVLPYYPEDSTETIIMRLETAIQAEEKRGRAGHWSFSMQRLIGLRQALKAEQSTIEP